MFNLIKALIGKDSYEILISETENNTKTITYEDDFIENEIDDSSFSDLEDYSLEEDNLPYVDITPEKLNLEYVSKLIKEIEELEKNPQLYDASRILYLHTELDAILERLEQ